MSKNRTGRNNQLSPPMQSALRKIYTEVSEQATHYPELSFRQSGATSIESLRYTSDVLGTEMPRVTKYLVRAALEQVGLSLYTRFKPLSGSSRLKEALLQSPFSYDVTTVTDGVAFLELLSIGNDKGPGLPSDQRMHQTYLNVSEGRPDKDKLVRTSALKVNEYNARSIEPEVALVTTYLREEEDSYQAMVGQQVIATETTGDASVGTATVSQMNSENPFVRSNAQIVDGMRRDFSEREQLGLIDPNIEELEELRIYIAGLF